MCKLSSKFTCIAGNLAQFTKDRGDGQGYHGYKLALYMLHVLSDAYLSVLTFEEYRTKSWVP